MIKSVHIRNFRGFKLSDVPDCRRLNVIVGQNGSGKTALLEALFFASGASAEIALRNRQWRGFDAPQLSATAAQLDESLWSDLFYDFDKNAKLSITLEGDKEHERQLHITFLPQDNILVPLKGRRPAGSDGPSGETILETAGVSFDWKGPFRQHIVSIARIRDGKLSFSGAFDPPFGATFYVANHPAYMAETVARFSRMSVQGELGPTIEEFRRQFPRVTDLSLEVLSGVPMLYAQVKAQRRRIPLNILSAGMSRMSAFLFTIASMPGGILLVDEVENGFYYKKLPSLWKALHTFCLNFDVQLFASTHSGECLVAASKLANEHPEDFSLIRAAANDGDGCSLRQFTGTEFAAAVDSDMEIR